MHEGFHPLRAGKVVFEEYKRAFCRVSGEPYHSSSSEGWAESDLGLAARKAAENAPGFIQAFFEACEALQGRGAVVPDHSLINHLLAQQHVPFRIEDGQLVASSQFVAPPDVPKDAASTASRAFSEAAGLVKKGQASSAIDRIHTALQAYLLELCGSAGIEPAPNRQPRSSSRCCASSTWHFDQQARGMRMSLVSFGPSPRSWTPCRPSGTRRALPTRIRCLKSPRPSS